MSTQNILRTIGLSIVYIVSISFCLSCSDTKGSFSFYAIDESELRDIERKWYFPKKFQKRKKPVIFHDNESLWYCYQPNSPNYDTPYTISLSQKYHGWLEMEVQNQRLHLGTGTLTGKLGNLAKGNYLLQVFSESQPLDRIIFDVFASEQEVVIDYNNLDIIQSAEAEDDIIFYSK